MNLLERTRAFVRSIAGKPLRRQRISSGVGMAAGKWLDEQIAELKDPRKRHEAFLRAYKTDGKVTQAVDDRLNALSNGSWEVIPASQSAEDVRIADFVAANLLGEDTDEFGREFWAQPVWPTRRWEVGFSMLVDGFCMYHKKFRQQGEFLILDKLTYIEPGTVDEWDLDKTDNIRSIVRTYNDPEDTNFFREKILAKDLMLYTHNLRGANYQGIALVRKMYPAFKRKEFFQRLKMVVSHRRFSAIPALEVPDSISPGSEEWDRFERFLQHMTNPDHDTAYIMASVLPKFLEAGSIQGLQELANYLASENMELVSAGGTKAMSLADDQSGSYALGETVSERETASHGSLAEQIVAADNFGVGGLPGLVQELVDINFDGVSKYPWLKFTPARDERAINSASIYLDGVQKGALTPNPRAEARVYEAIGWSDLADEDEIIRIQEERAAKAAAIATGGGDGQDDNEDESEEGEGTPPATDNEDDDADE